MKVETKAERLARNASYVLRREAGLAAQRRNKARNEE